MALNDSSFGSAARSSRPCQLALNDADDEELELRDLAQEGEVPLEGDQRPDAASPDLADQGIAIRVAEGDPATPGVDLPALRRRERIELAALDQQAHLKPRPAR